MTDNKTKVQVKEGELSVKSVKKRSRKKVPDGQEALTPLFGSWQVEKYIPPPVSEGKVPRNEHGNVYLFAEWMLPEGAARVICPGWNFGKRS